MDPTKEIEGKRAHDPHYRWAGPTSAKVRRVWVPGPVIVGGGPSGLAVAACLKDKGIPRVILERSNCVGSLWQLRTYDRLRLHLPKHFCQLPLLPFPVNFPNYPSKQDFITYLESYATHFNLRPILGTAVLSAQFDSKHGLWRVRTSGPKKTGVGVSGEGEVEYLCKWVVVASGENSEPYVPEIEGREDFVGPILHSSEYKRGDEFKGKRVLVVGCGNSGMEVCLDLCNHNAFPSLVVRESVHILPQKMLGTSTFGLSTSMLKWLPINLVDTILLTMSRLILGDTSELGLTRPTMGPFEYKTVSGKTPVLDMGTLAKIKSGDIKVFPGIKRLMHNGLEFVDGRIEKFDAIILATGYTSNVPSWLKGTNMFSEKDGYPVKPYPEGWKGEKGLYAVGFTKRGLLGASHDAMMIAEDIDHDWKTKANAFSDDQSSI